MAELLNIGTLIRGIYFSEKNGSKNLNTDFEEYQTYTTRLLYIRVLLTYRGINARGDSIRAEGLTCRGHTSCAGWCMLQPTFSQHPQDSYHNSHDAHQDDHDQWNPIDHTFRPAVLISSPVMSWYAPLLHSGATVWTCSRAVASRAARVGSSYRVLRWTVALPMPVPRGANASGRP